jgi:hypothetical protein
MLWPRAEDLEFGPAFEENLALVQTMFGESSRAISALKRPHYSWLYTPAPIASVFLRLDPIWDHLRADPAFQKLCEERQP